MPSDCRNVPGWTRFRKEKGNSEKRGKQGFRKGKSKDEKYKLISKIEVATKFKEDLI